MRTFVVTAALFTCLTIPAFAQSTPSANSSQMDAASASSDQKSPADNAQNNGGAQNRAAVQRIRQDLQNAGFTDVKVVAESFVVQAKSRDGNPVLMTIGPHGMSVFEAMANGGANGSSNSGNTGTVGSGAAGSGANRANPDNSDTGSSMSQSPGTQK